MRLKGAGLVHEPNLHLKALATQEAPMLNPKTRPATPPNSPQNPNPGTSLRSPLIVRLMKVLNLAPDATEEELMDSLEAWLNDQDKKPDPKEYVPVATVQAMLAATNLQKAVMSKNQAAAKVEDSIRRSLIPPAMRDWALTLCKQDAGAFDNFLASSAPLAYGHLTRELTSGTPPGAPRPVSQSEAEAAICHQLGLKPGQLSTG
jgi:phage I-like protein